MTNQGKETVNIIKIKDQVVQNTLDVVTQEEPLEISITKLDSPPMFRKKAISITMRTEGNDKELALGFLFSEGIIQSIDQIKNIRIDENKVDLVLQGHLEFDASKLERHFYTTSSCGVCGKASIDALKIPNYINKSKSSWKIDAQLIKKLPTILRSKQAVFETTGSLHAAALFDQKGHFLLLKEDVGRHNAMDKLIGYYFNQHQLPLSNHILLLSGRTSFELVQKSVMAGIQVITSIGAPSSLAVQLAKEYNITLIGFLKLSSFNIYHAAERINLSNLVS